ncbi:DUF4304 domain-containing protein [Pararhizobium sp. A13]|uniref:DUF4304 domain-containing protein n=1 Tax=Pararhizobium sp. A13 TaxID=3133975 RepID=UPI00311B11BF
MEKALSLEASIRNHFAPVLRRDGFKGSGRIFRATVGDMICVVNVQGSVFGGRFAVNLGVQPIAVPSVTGAITDPKKIVESSCEFGRRLSDEGVDHWWDYSDQTTLDRAVDEAARMYQKVGRSFFERFTSSDNELREIAPDSSIPHGYAADLRTSEARLFRALAHMRLVANKADEAVRFAKMALANGGPSWQAYSELQSLIQRAQN